MIHASGLRRDGGVVMRTHSMTTGLEVRVDETSRRIRE